MLTNLFLHTFTDTFMSWFFQSSLFSAFMFNTIFIHRLCNHVRTSHNSNFSKNLHFLNGKMWCNKKMMEKDEIRLTEIESHNK